ncbi:MAG: gas vesicle protein [Candidatus Sumerlaeota bacterium]|nr:gas vesicle protein [Candidatus Sumerlaeota bacterium]
MPVKGSMQHSIESTNLADLLERVLDKGIVIAGDIKIKLVDIELLTIQIRLLICSVDKAREMGIDWWTNNPALSSSSQQALPAGQTSTIEDRLNRLEAAAASASLPVKH